MKRALLISCVAVMLLGCPEGTEVPDAGRDAGVVAQERDLDVVVLKLTPDGVLDERFGTGGKVVLDEGQTTGTGRDSVYGMDVDAQGRAVLFGSSKSRSGDDQDRLIWRLTAAGARDVSFGDQGVVRLDLGGTEESARHGFVQPDGRIVASGYSPLKTGALLPDGGPATANTIVLQRLEHDGRADLSFGDGGVVTANPFGPVGVSEAYAVVAQRSGDYVTTGYGRAAASGTVDLISFRFTADGGALDPTWGSGGRLTFDLLGGDDRGRNAAVLPDDRVISVGSATVAPGNIDGLVLISSATGGVESTKTFSFERSDEALFGVALNADASQLAAVGHRVGAANTATVNDDGALVLLPLQPGAPAEVSRVAPLAAAAPDRFTAVAFSGAKVLAVGFVRDGGDSQFAIARFNADGTADTAFGDQGVRLINVTPLGGPEETARAITVLADGALIIAGVAEH